VSADFSSLGLAVGHATDDRGATGCTVIRGADGPLRGGVAIFGRATGSRELAAVTPPHVADRVDAVFLTGGSAYGLDAAAGVMRWMEERGRGHAVPGGVVPIVPAAVIFDLAPLGRFDARPTAEMAYAACADASASAIAEGSVGAGTGATVGKIDGPARAMKGGVGCALVSSGGLHVGAVTVVNALGDVRDGSGRIIAGARNAQNGFVDTAARIAGADESRSERAASLTMQNTTLSLVATNVPLDRVALAQLARAAGAALFRRITPTGTTVDGDIVFALSPHGGGVGSRDNAPLSTLQIEGLAVQALEQAIERAVRTARGRDGVLGLADAS
jgi:L-aminopeptidase/D-esterase-like protein